MPRILLGYETGTAREVYVEPSHMVCCGLTQKSGKTTTLEALARRSGQTVLIFQTKPGEAALAGEYHAVPPYFSGRADWQYVEALLSAVMKEKMKFERSWIIRMTKGVTKGGIEGLKEIDKRCETAADAAKEGSLEQSVYINLHAYFGLVIPELERIQGGLSRTLELKPGINCMDLSEMRDEVQSLIIRSVLEYVLQNLKGTVVIISELWKFEPEGRGNPVKPVMEALIRQGAARQNYVWADSQDLAGVDKAPLKQVFTWIMGLQTERNEVQHTLDQIPLGKKEKPKAEDIMKLQLGHFILATPQMVKNVYVLPSWLDPEAAKGIALGVMRFEDIPEIQKKVRQAQTGVAQAEKLNEPVFKALYEKERARVKELEAAVANAVEPLRKQVAEMRQKAAEDRRSLEEMQAELSRLREIAKGYEGLDRFFTERIGNMVEVYLRERVPRGTGASQGAIVGQQQFTIQFEEKPMPPLRIDDSTLRGKVVGALPAGKWFSTQDIVALFAAGRYGGEWEGQGKDAPVSAELNKMVDEGFLTKRKNVNRTINFRLADNVKIARREA